MNRRLVFSLAALLGGTALLAALWFPGALVRSPWRSRSPAQAVDGGPDPLMVPTLLPLWLDVRVVVRDAETAGAVAGADVRIGEARGQTDAQGVCVLRVAGGGWRVAGGHGQAHGLQVRAARYRDWQEQIEVGDPGRMAGETPAIRLTPVAGGTPVVQLALDVALEPIEVRGQVTGDGSKPLPSARLTWNGQLVPLNEQGEFVLRRVAPGDHISATHPAYRPYQFNVGHGLFDGTPFQLSLIPLSVTVGVRDRMTGQAIPAASVCAVLELMDGDICASTDGSGNALLREVVHDAELVVRHNGYLTATLVYRGQDTLSFELAPQQLHGVIRDAESGQPLTRAILFVNGQVVPLLGEGRYHLPDLTQVYTLFVKSPGHERIAIPTGPDTKTSRYDALDACLEPDRLPCVDINLPRFSVRGIYINFNLLMWDRERVLELIDFVDRSPILNAIVVDIKGDRGYIALASDDPLIVSGQAMSTPRLPLTEFLRICKKKHIYTIARMVIFKDNELIKARPELAVRHPNGAIFYDREGLAWGDPTLEEVWAYNIAITREAIRLGFDEIQYDYLRYPSDSTSLAVVRALVYSIPSTLESRTAAIEGFVAAAKAAVDPTPAFLSADLFGFALSVDPEHDMRIGQRLMDLAPHVDYVCPMVYPSTFIPGNLGLQSPPDHPYEVVAISLAYGLSRTDTLIRPWLQHYWYDRYEIAEQRRAAEEATDAGWCYWNAGGRYDELFFIPPQGLEP